ncbi:MAG: carboxypeptidase M32 [Erysipelotrichaceae bacterium]|nr:carboxypeptidase M32 [Erysipelotrichaceae bacterium]
MNKKQAIAIFKDHEYKLSVYRLFLSTFSYDKETIAPRKGNDYRNRRYLTMAEEYYKIQTDPEAIEAIEYLSTLMLDHDLAKSVELYKKDIDAMTKIGKDNYMAMENYSVTGYDKWLEAKGKGDYAIFEDAFKDLIRQSIINVKARAKKGQDIYDVLLDDYEPGMTMAKSDEFFDLIKKEILPLIKKIAAKKDQIDDSFLYKRYPIKKQKRYTEILRKALRFDESWGYISESEHPFTDGFSANDTRITTNYSEYSLSDSMYSIIHETGHAYFEHQVDPRYDGTILKRAISSGMHESQSRLLENYIGRRKSFIAPLYKRLQSLFKDNLGDISLEDFTRAINVSRPSLIRTEADELTYPIHILIRYEIEKQLISKQIKPEKLNKVWNDKYKEYLEVTPKNDAQGILQDIHWSGASFGYFPTYALGSAIAAQIMYHMEKELPVDELLESKKIKTIMDWLKKHVHHYGASLSVNELLKKEFNEEFDPKYYVDYLKKKYSELYDL